MRDEVEVDQQEAAEQDRDLFERLRRAITVVKKASDKTVTMGHSKRPKLSAQL